MPGIFLRIINRLIPRKIGFAVLIVTEPDEDRFHAFCPALKGLHADGATAEEAAHNAGQLAVLYVESLLKHRDPIPLGLYICKEKNEPMISHVSSEYCETKTFQVAIA